MNVELTKSGKAAVAVIYSAYLKRRKNGAHKSAAVYFKDDADNAALFEAISQDIAELQKAKLIKSDILGGFELQDSAIILMENQPAEKLKELLTLASQVLPPVVSKILEAYS